MLDIIARLEKEYNIKLDDFLKYYKEGVGRESMCKLLNSTTHKVRIYASSLGLRWALKHREGDLLLLKNKLDSKIEGGNKDIITELVDDLDLVSDNLTKFHKKLVNCRDENTILRRQIRECARNERYFNVILDEFKQHIDEFTVDFKKYTNETLDSSNKGLTILALSDLHLGSLVEKEDVGSVNEYNISIAEERLNKCFTMLNNEHTRDIEIVVLGDILQGVIHQSNLTGELPVVSALTKFVSIFSGLVLPLQTKFENIHITLTNSNHARLSENVAFYKKGYDFDFLIYSFLKEVFKGTRVCINYDVSGFNLIKLPNNNYGFAFHSDTIRKYDVGNPSSLLQVIDLCKTMYQVEPTLLLNGHFHKYKSALMSNGGLACTVGSMIGMDDYAFHSGFIKEVPSQLILSYDEYGELNYQKLIKF